MILLYCHQLFEICVPNIYSLTVRYNRCLFTFSSDLSIYKKKKRKSSHSKQRSANSLQWTITRGIFRVQKKKPPPFWNILIRRFKPKHQPSHTLLIYQSHTCLFCITITSWTFLILDTQIIVWIFSQFLWQFIFSSHILSNIQIHSV